MTRLSASLLTALVALTSAPGLAVAAEPEKITVAYFEEWPTANQVAQAEKWYDEALGVPSQPQVDILALDDALRTLKRLDERQHQIVEFRFFGGLTVPETAELLGISPATVKREWTVAKAWLLHQVQRV